MRKEVECCIMSRSFAYPKWWKAGEGKLQKPRGLLGTQTVLGMLKIAHAVLFPTSGTTAVPATQVQCCATAASGLHQR